MNLNCNEYGGCIYKSFLLPLAFTFSVFSLPASAVQETAKSTHCAVLDGKPGENGHDGLSDTNCKNGGNGGQGDPNINNGTGGNGGDGASEGGDGSHGSASYFRKDK